MRKFWLASTLFSVNPGVCSMPDPDPNEGGGGGGGGGGGSPAAPFYASIEDADLRGWVEQAGYKDLPGMAKSLRDTVAMRGKPAEAFVELPDFDNAEAANAFYDRIGRPADVAGYELALPDGGDEDFHGHMLGLMHQTGVSKRTAQALFKGWQDYATARLERENAELTSRQEAELASLKGQGGGGWGGNFDALSEQARRAFRKFGGDEAQMGLIEQTIGTANFLKMFQRIGEAMGESAYHDDKGDKGGRPSGFKLSPEAATARKAELMNDAGFRERFMKNDAAAVREINELNQILAAAM